MAIKYDSAKLKKIAAYQRRIEAIIMLTDTPEDVKMLAALFIMAAQRSFVATEGFDKAKDILLNYCNNIEKPIDTIEIFKKPLDKA